MGRIFRGLLTGALGISMLLGSMGAGAAAAETVKDYEGHWAQNTIEKWLDKGLLKGFENGSVKPDQSITRAEFMAIVNRSFEIASLFDKKEVPKITFSDVSSTSWAYKEVAMAVGAGYIQGYNNEARPNAQITRQEAAVIVGKLLKLELPENTTETLAGFSDRGEVAAWSAGSVAAAINASYMKGYPDGTFKPKRSLTRAEAVTLIEPMLQVSGDGEIYDHSGVYGGTDEQHRETTETVVISAAGVTLQNVTIVGNLLLDAGIGNGDVTLKNVTVRGTTTVKGGGGDSLHFINSELGDVVVNKAGGAVRLVAEGTTTVKQVKAQTPVKLEESGATGAGFTNVSVEQDFTSSGPVVLSGVFDTVNINAKAVMQLAKGSVAALSIGTGAANSSVDMASGTKVTKAVLDAFTKVTGAGQVETAVLNDGAKGSSFNTKPLSVEGPQKDSLVIATASATPTPAVIIGGGGGGGGSVATPAPTPTVAPTPVPTATPASTATPVPTSPVKEIPLLQTYIIASPDATVRNAVYLQFDVSSIPESILKSASTVSYYITSTPVNERDLRWELNNRRAYSTKSTLVYRSNPIYTMTVYNDYFGTGGDQYVTLVFRGKEGAVGYSTQKVNFPPSLTGYAANFTKLASGVTIERDKQMIDGSAKYSDIIDVSNVFAQNAEAAYYTITPKYLDTVASNYELSKLLSYSLRLYNQKRIRVVETYYYPQPVDDIPLAVEVWKDLKTNIEQEYTIIFYDKTLQAISYYNGKVHLSDQLAVEAAEERINEIQGYSDALRAENSILRASSAYSALSDSLKAQVSQTNKDKLEKALNELETMKHAGPLGSSLSLVSTGIQISGLELNGTTIGVYNQDYPYTLRSETSFMSFYLTENPITLADIQGSNGIGIQPFSDLAYLRQLDKKGEYYVTVVFRDKNLQPASYATQRITTSPNTPVWDGTAVQVKEGVSLLREYDDSLRMDYVTFKDYLKTHPEAAYFSFTTRSDLATAGKDFTADQAVQQINPYQSTAISYTHTYYPIRLEDNQALNGQPEDYIIIFYDKNFKAIHYYIGTLTD
ncbi:S-layer homology domain-containing protein [Paenibacillus sp. HW567]|uniref:S-layer homology domain-containing protein n=1 Tax=Paenibacillus sp. HW567 TaxID=1034769 RepID=UPI0018DE81A1|nr:S-layer homology domain-containing protein [Paenibacillus sp. HW567]